MYCARPLIVLDSQSKLKAKLPYAIDFFDDLGIASTSTFKRPCKGHAIYDRLFSELGVVTANSYPTTVQRVRFGCITRRRKVCRSRHKTERELHDFVSIFLKKTCQRLHFGTGTTIGVATTDRVPTNVSNLE